MLRNVLLLAGTAGGAAVGFWVVDSFRDDARKQKGEFVERIIREEQEKKRQAEASGARDRK